MVGGHQHTASRDRCARQSARHQADALTCRHRGEQTGARRRGGLERATERHPDLRACSHVLRVGALARTCDTAHHCVPEGQTRTRARARAVLRWSEHLCGHLVAARIERVLVVMDGACVERRTRLWVLGLARFDLQEQNERHM